MSSASTAPQVRTDDTKLERTADSLLNGFTTVIIDMLRAGQPPQEVIDTVHNDIQKKLRKAHPSASNLEQVLSSNHKKVVDLVNKLKMEVDAKKTKK